jgi:hypothetical protein
MNDNDAFSQHLATCGDCKAWMAAIEERRKTDPLFCPPRECETAIRLAVEACASDASAPVPVPIKLSINGVPCELLPYHAEHIVDTLLGNTLHGSDGWREAAVDMAREGMQRRDSSHGYTGHAQSSVEAYAIAEAHERLAEAIHDALDRVKVPGPIPVVVDGQEYAFVAGDFAHVNDTLGGYRDHGAPGWEESAAHEGREYVRIKNGAIQQHVNFGKPELDAQNALAMQTSALNIAKLHRDLAVALSHAAGGRHPYCRPDSCDVVKLPETTVAAARERSRTRNVLPFRPRARSGR